MPAVYCQWYEKLSDLDTLVLLRNLHYEWSQIDVIQFSELLNIIDEKPDPKKLAGVMPENEEEINNIINLLDFDWKKFEQSQRKSFVEDV